MSNDINTENNGSASTSLDRAYCELTHAEGLITTALISLDFAAKELSALLPGELTERQAFAADALDGLKAILEICDDKICSARSNVISSQ